MPGEGFYRVTLIQTMYGQQINNVINLTGPVADQGALVTLANEMDTIWITNVMTMQSQAVRYTGIKVHALDTTLPVHTKTINKFSNVGFDSQLDTVQGFIIRLRTGFAGRHGRGRVYIPGVLKGWTEQGLVTQNIINSWDAVFAAILGNAGFGSSPYTLCVGNKTPPYVFHPISNMLVAPTLGHQRRRNIGVGV